MLKKHLRIFTFPVSVRYLYCIRMQSDEKQALFGLTDRSCHHKNSRLYRYIYIKNGIYFIILQHRISIEIWPQKKEFISEVSSESFSTVVCCSSSSRLLTSSISLPGKSFYPSEAFLPTCS